MIGTPYVAALALVSAGEVCERAGNNLGPGRRAQLLNQLFRTRTRSDAATRRARTATASELKLEGACVPERSLAEGCPDDLGIEYY
jgi:hypothetical protein